MSLLDRVQTCNRLDLSETLAFMVDNVQHGWVTAKRAAVLVHHRDIFEVSADTVRFAAHVTTPDQRSKALARIAPALTASGLFPKTRGELYAAKTTWSAPAAFTLDRSLVAGFGLRAFGVHLNGYVRRPDGLHLWIGTRAMDREVEPGKLDNMVAGGQPAGLTLADNLLKECQEEAGLPATLAGRARPVGALSYAFTSASGIKSDTLFCFDLELDETVIPRNTDGEISGFTLMSLAEVLSLVRETERFKFNVPLVIIDFAIRHGVLNPDTEPDFERLLAGLHNRIEHNSQGFIFSEQ